MIEAWTHIEGSKGYEVSTIGRARIRGGSGESAASIARSMGVSQSSAYNAIIGATWSHVQV
jgi:hypothetical protein